MYVTVNLDSFWVGLVAGWISLVVVSVIANTAVNRKKK